MPTLTLHSCVGEVAILYSEVLLLIVPNSHSMTSHRHLETGVTFTMWELVEAADPVLRSYNPVAPHISSNDGQLYICKYTIYMSA